MRKNRKGFTVIEVVLVLAVAGLIFAMVFIAIPALQVSRRDMDRKTDIEKLISDLKKYQQNNRGALPKSDTTVNGNLFDMEPSSYSTTVKNAAYTSWIAFYRDYLGNKYRDPLGYMYNLKVVSCGASADENCVDAVNGIRETFFHERTDKYTIIIATGAKCVGDRAVGTSNPRNAAALSKLEGAGAICANP